MKSVAVALPEEIASWLRAQAAENGRSLSRWLVDLLERMRHQEGEYEAAMECALAFQPEILNEGGALYPVVAPTSGGLRANFGQALASKVTDRFALTVCGKRK